MDTYDLIVILLLAFPVGMIHALDADHIAAVTGMIDKKSGVGNSIRFCLNWAMGHSVTLLFIGALIFLFSINIPDSVAAYAEFFVGVLLLMIGIGIAIEFFRKDVHLHFHKHDDKPVHAHWHTHQGDVKNDHSHQHKAVLVGILHGAAGYAPLIAIIPFTLNDSPWFALLYFLVFGLGVFISMLIVGGVIGILLKDITNRSTRVMNVFRAIISTVAVSVGSILIFRVVSA